MAPPGGCLSCPSADQISWIDTSGPEETSSYTRAWGVPRNRMDVVTQNTDPHIHMNSLKIPVNPPYSKLQKPRINHLALPIRLYYTSQDLCKVLGIKPDTFRYRLRQRYYPDAVLRVGGRRRFMESEIRELIKITEEFLKKGLFKTQPLPIVLPSQSFFRLQHKTLQKACIGQERFWKAQLLSP
jgi:hypothetical protein